MYNEKSVTFMEKYEFLCITRFPDWDSYILNCTHTSELEFLLSQLKQFFPKHEFRLKKLPSGEIYEYYFKVFYSSRVQYDDALWWTIKQLCLRGWEPMGATSSGVANGAFYNFKRKVLP